MTVNFYCVVYHKTVYQTQGVLSCKLSSCGIDYRRGGGGGDGYSVINQEETQADVIG